MHKRFEPQLMNLSIDFCEYLIPKSLITRQDFFREIIPSRLFKPCYAKKKVQMVSSFFWECKRNKAGPAALGMNGAKRSYVLVLNTIKTTLIWRITCYAITVPYFTTTLHTSSSSSSSIIMVENLNQKIPKIGE